MARRLLLFGWAAQATMGCERLHRCPLLRLVHPLAPGRCVGSCDPPPPLPAAASSPQQSSCNALAAAQQARVHLQRYWDNSEHTTLTPSKQQVLAR
jgi:hypothetical protein